MARCRYCKKEIEEGSLCDNPVCKAKEELEGYRKMFHQVRRYRAKLRTIKEQFYGMRSIDYEKIKSGEGKDRDLMLSLLCKMEEVEECISTRILEAEKKGLEIQKKIDRLPYPYNEILVKRYIEFKTFEKIAVELNYCFKQVCRIHDKALRLYAEIETCPIMSYSVSV